MSRSRLLVVAGVLAAMAAAAAPARADSAEPAPPYPRRQVPPSPPRQTAPPPRRVYYPPPPVVADPPPLSPVMRVLYAPFYAAGLVIRYGVYYGIVAPIEVFARTVEYGVNGGVSREPPPRPPSEDDR